LIATLIATALSTWFYYLGLARMLWPAHPRMAAFVITLDATLAVQIFWPSAPPNPIRRHQTSVALRPTFSLLC